MDITYVGPHRSQLRSGLFKHGHLFKFGDTPAGQYSAFIASPAAILEYPALMDPYLRQASSFLGLPLTDAARDSFKAALTKASGG